MSNDGHFLEASTSRCKKQSRTSKEAEKLSVDLFQEDVKSRKRKAEIKQLEGRLRVLEEEAEMLKGALLESVEENKKLITEIRHHFKTINRRLLQREVEREELYSQIVWSTELRKVRIIVRIFLNLVLIVQVISFCITKSTSNFTYLILDYSLQFTIVHVLGDNFYLFSQNIDIL